MLQLENSRGAQIESFDVIPYEQQDSSEQKESSSSDEEQISAQTIMRTIEHDCNDGSSNEESEDNAIVGEYGCETWESNITKTELAEIEHNYKLYLLYKEMGFDSFYVEEFAYFFMIKANVHASGFYYACRCLRKALISIHNICSSMDNWISKWFWYPSLKYRLSRIPGDRLWPMLEGKKLLCANFIGELSSSRKCFRQLCTSANLVRKQYLKLVAEKKKPAEYKYTVYGFSAALQYWAYEVVPTLGTVYATNLGVKFPKMLCWTSNKIPSASDVGEILNRKKEKDFHGRILTSIHGPKVTHGTDESVGDPDELDANEEYLKESEADIEELKVTQLEIKQQQGEMMKLLITLVKKKDKPEITESDKDIMPDSYRSAPSTTL
ncbi:hypothetical protein TorRG33x02_158200 [Trema orientale]|uniref:Ulp1 protease family, C-terminal catalytic domain containing protein n=1 Tax=Trema orientale TaxID=63057 RepID=A0A2P5ESD2_TREOI|nr:hypothetical protein TorRG33x02_158200 [Trema orientale]